MFSYLFTFYSQTAAQGGRGILQRHGVRGQLRRAPQQAAGPGCTWALAVAEEDGRRALALLRQYGQPPVGVYRLRANGFVEAVRL